MGHWFSQSPITAQARPLADLREPRLVRMLGNWFDATGGSLAYRGEDEAALLGASALLPAFGAVIYADEHEPLASFIMRQGRDYPAHCSHAPLRGVRLMEFYEGAPRLRSWAGALFCEALAQSWLDAIARKTACYHSIPYFNERGRLCQYYQLLLPSLREDGTLSMLFTALVPARFPLAKPAIDEAQQDEGSGVLAMH